MSEPWVVSDDPAAIHWPEAASPVTLCGQATRGRRVADAVPAVTCSWCIGLLTVAGVLPRSPAARGATQPVERFRYPYVGDGLDGCLRSAQIDLEEAEMLPREDPRRDELEASANGWFRQAQELLPEALRNWAVGWLPQMAAVEFVLGIYPNLDPRHAMVGRHSEDEGGGWYLDVYCDDEEWDRRTAQMSGGELATWLLARSLAKGELAEQFGRLDVHRRRAFSEALEIWNLG